MLLTRLLRSVFSGALKVHTGQWAEDVLVRKLLSHIDKGTYLDLGAYHPFIHSNTAGLWLKGWGGVNVDANPNSIRLFDKTRKDDINIWAAIVPESQLPANGRIMLSVPKSRDNTQGISARGSCHPDIAATRNMTEMISVPALSTNEIIEKSGITTIDYMNIDIEGMDEAILKEFDFDKYAPKIVSCEDYGRSITEIANSPITHIMQGKGYELISRAGPTSIFARAA